MQYGQEVSVHKWGVEMPAKAVEPIGLVDGSRAWGVWIDDLIRDPDRSPDDASESPEKSRPTPHLIISSISPRHWATCFRMQVRMANRPGAMHRATRFLASQDVNILWAEQAQAGFRHAVWNIVATFEGLAGIADELIRKARGNERREPAPPNPRETAALAKIGLLMSSGFARLKRKLLELTTKGRSGRLEHEFLYDKVYGADGAPYTGARKPWQLGLTALSDVLVKFPPDSKRGEDGSEALAEFLAAKGAPDFRALERGTKVRPRESGGPTDARIEAKIVRSLDDFPRGSPVHDVWTVYQNQHLDPVRLRAMDQLAFFRMFGVNVERPVALRYEAARGALIPDFDTIPRAFADVSGVRSEQFDLPTRALACIDVMEHSVRLALLPRCDVERRLYLIELDYSASTPDRRADAGLDGEARSGAGRSTRGLLKRVCKSLLNLKRVEPRLRGHEVNLERVSNRISDQTSSSEEGSIRLVAHFVNRSICDDDEIVCRALRAAVERAAARGSRRGLATRVRELKVSRYPQLRAFLSMPMAFPRRDDVVAILKEALHEHAVEAVMTTTNDTGVTVAVGDDVATCDAFVQIITLRESERDELVRRGSVKPDFGWLLFEYGLASARGLRPIRVRDRMVTSDMLRAAFPVAQDVPNEEFDSAAATTEIERRLREVAKVVSAAAAKRRASKGGW